MFLYRRDVDIDNTLNTINIRPGLIEKMIENDENDILIYEVKYNTKSNLQEV